jgi:4-hydroxy-tetrahydrodipicolinate synthase
MNLHEKYLPFFGALFYETNPSPVKAAMKQLGLAAEGLRLPMVDMAESNLSRLLEVMQQVGLTKKVL